MRNIEIPPGTSIENAAELLRMNAPARGTFNGIEIVAKYSTTRPADIVAQYLRLSDERRDAYDRSPAAKAREEERVKNVAKQQAIVDACIAGLYALKLDAADTCDAIDTVLAWTERMADAANYVDVKYDHDTLVWYFAAHGWSAGANCGSDFDGEDPRNVAGWIVGQWLKCRYPAVDVFVADWREKFMAPMAQAA